MKKLLFLSILSLLMLGCTNSENFNDSNEYDLVYENIENCKKDLNVLYKEDDFVIYEYCIKDIYIDINDEKILLNNALNEKLITIEDIIAKMHYDDNSIYKDGGSILYEADTYKVLSCKSLQENKTYNRDYIIGNKKMEYETNFCK